MSSSRAVVRILNFLIKSNFVADTMLWARNWGLHKTFKVCLYINVNEELMVK